MGSSRVSARTGSRCTGGSSQVRGLAIGGFSGSGIVLQTGGNNRIAGNYLGTNVTGMTALGNNFGVHLLAGSSNNTIGGTIPGDGNLISGNATGVEIHGGANGNLVQGNTIGLNATGTTALGNSSSGIVIHNGGGAATNNTIGGTVAVARNVISGNVDGIVIRDSGTMGNQVQGNYIGTNAAGTAAVGGGTWGVLVTTNASNNVIGGTAAGAGNVIVGHSQAGIGIGSGATGNVVQGNLIGLNAAGTAALGNTVGVLIQVSAVSNIVGGTTAASRNVISGNSQHGIRVNDVGSTGNQVRGNYIGTNAAGIAAIPNGTGVRVESAPGNFIGGTAPGEGNLISGNGGVGVVIDGVNGNGADGNVLQNNLIGTTADGSAALGNGAEGVVVHANYTQIGGTTPGARNVISGNTTYGIRVLNHGVGNVVEGNYIGTNLSGTAAIPNVDGVRIEQISGQRIGGSSPGAGNVISGNTQEGVYFFWCDLILPGCDAGNDVQGNRIGTRADGLTALPNGGNGIRIHAARNNRIGGTAAGAGNVVSGNIDAGIFIRSADGQPQTANGTVIQGNIIGLDAIGAASLGNGADGIGLTNAGAQIGGTQPGARNVISSNQNGIVFSNSGSPHTSLIEGNYIGTDITGMLDRGTGIGVSVGSAPGITIGGTAVGAGNVISGNQTGVSITNSSNTVVRGNIIGLNAAGTGPLGNSIGVTVTSGTRNTILTNSIFSNVGVGLGIDLGPAGVTPNDAGDADTGANDLQNFPVITSATTTQIQGTLNSTANTTFTIQLFTNAMCDASGNGEGQTMLGTVAGVSTDGSGNAVFSLTSPFAAPLAAGQYVTATATDSNGSTSEFSACTTVNAALAVLNTNDSGAGSLRQAILDAESNPDVSAIVFDIPGAGPHTIVPASPLPTTTTPVLIDGHSQPGASPGNPKIVLNGSAPGLGLGVSALTLGGASSLVRGLVINGFPGPGMTITSSGNTIRSNFIGTNPTGTAAVANAQGILIGSTATNNVIGGDLLDHRNIISGNSEWGIGIEGDGNSVLGNHVGTNVSGTAAVPNGGTGVVVFDGASGNIIGGTTAGAGNVIAGNGASGLGRGISATNVSGLTIQGNKIGTNASGTAALPNANQGIDFINVTGSLIGGIVAGAGNVISGNGGNPGIGGGDGIRLGSGSGTTIQGNKIGTDITGTTALPNVGDGINFNGASNSTVGGTVAGAGNLISGNSGPGIGIFGSSSGNHVEGNSIGLNASGTGGLANTDGVQVTGSGNFIGGTSPGAGNTVAFNQYNGVLVMFGTSNLISSNSIFSNGGIGIDLGGDGITANDGPVDGDAGANNLQNFPHISGVITTTSVAGEIFTAADVDFTVEIFSSDTANHEGKTLVTTTVVHTDLAGHAFIGPLPVTLTSGQWVTGPRPIRVATRRNSRMPCRCRSGPHSGLGHVLGELKTMTRLSQPLLRSAISRDALPHACSGARVRTRTNLVDTQVPSVREHVEVVATRVPEAPDDVPVAIEVISGDELRDRGITDLRGALALATGVDVAPGGDGGPASFVPEFWGLKEFDAFLLVVDDVPWGGAFNPALSTLDLHDLERIEILRGPAPVMFGATSFVGVIHVVHRNASIASRDLSARLGSFGSGAGSAAFAVSLGDWQSRLTVDGERQGFSDDRTSFRRGHVSWRGSRSSTGGRTWFAVDGTLLNQNPASPHVRVGSGLTAAVPLDANHNPSGAFLNDRRVSVWFGVDRTSGMRTWTTMASVSRGSHDILRGFLQDVSNVGLNARGLREQIDLTDLYADTHVAWSNIRGMRLLLGADFLHGMGDAKGADFLYHAPLDGSVASSVVAPSTLDVAIGDRRDFAGGYVSAEWNPWRRLRFDAGVRLNVTNEERKNGNEAEAANAGANESAQNNVQAERQPRRDLDRVGAGCRSPAAVRELSQHVQTGSGRFRDRRRRRRAAEARDGAELRGWCQGPRGARACRPRGDDVPHGFLESGDRPHDERPAGADQCGYGALQGVRAGNHMVSAARCHGPRELQPPRREVPRLRGGV